jgi:protein TonB
MNILKPSAFHTTLPNIQLVINNASVKPESLAFFRFPSITEKPEQVKKPISLPTVILVALLHVLVGMLLLQNQETNQPASSGLPMMVTMIRAQKIEPTPAPVKPVNTKSIVNTQPKVVATTQEKAKIQATEEKPQWREPTLPAAEPKIAEVDEIAIPAKVALSETALKPEPKPEPVYIAPSVGANYLHNPAPEYPQMARRRGEQGRVLIKVLVTSQGDASNVTLEKSSGSNHLDEAAIKAVKNWKFVPARSNNEAVSGYVTVPINFSLES